MKTENCKLWAVSCGLLLPAILLGGLCASLFAQGADAQVLYQTDFPCYPEGVTKADDKFGTTTYWPGIWDRAGNIKDPLDHTGNGTCSARVGAGANGYGKLLVRLPDSSYGELWLRGWVYFHENYPVPCCGDVLISPHLWRFHEPNWRFERDFSTVQGQDRVRDFYFWKVSGGAPEIVRYYDSNFHFASADRRGRWQCWEIRTKLNTPGAADGISEFYADGVLIGRHEGLNIRGSTTYGYGKVDIQSNIAIPTGAAMPPDMWWLVDDVVIATARVGCGPPSTGGPAEDPVVEPEPTPDPEPEPDGPIVPGDTTAPSLSLRCGVSYCDISASDETALASVSISIDGAEYRIAIPTGGAITNWRVRGLKRGTAFIVAARDTTGNEARVER